MKLVGLRAVGLLGCVALLSSAAVSGEETDPVVLETAEAVAGTEAITGGENVAPEGEEAPVMEPGLVGEQNAEIEANTKSSAGKSGAKKALILSVFLTLMAAAGAVDYFVTGVTPLKKMIEGMLGSEAAEDLSEAGQTKEEETEEKAEQAGEEEQVGVSGHEMSSFSRRSLVVRLGQYWVSRVVMMLAKRICVMHAM
ncbi:hypothetical protein EMWEY_00057110 [Eimeria maxima]|uniref:Transmembrane protein n=1 Tax=Eimeria maxima TaxID=5804 RepID=U6MCH1_EIMMA|nr:hypothetical protein EMWEY_00057110 [Eimeria maxima]CDJ59365.1 hypothetical protein EMWEY_00057110 [Eimeria maxima]